MRAMYIASNEVSLMSYANSWFRDRNIWKDKNSVNHRAQS